ncbi:MAG: hypothetical protein M3128_14920 [Verrucomicrobiota bacterium]|nr:hypothetical protein [Verrucomicrobiota bacterium]
MNSVLFQSGLFFGSLVLMSVSSFVLTVALERIGASLKLSEGLLGIVTALGADSPEISASIMALSAGHRELGVGVVLGSNIFNLAALLGLSALLTGLVRVRTADALFSGGIALLATIIGAAVIIGLLPAPLALLLIFLLVGPYIWVVALSPTRLKRLPLPHFVATFLVHAVEPIKQDVEKHGRPRASLLHWLLVLPALFAIVAGSRGIVNATVWLAGRFSISHAVAGTLGIAALTGIPNAVAAIRLAQHGRGAAVAAECFNSNTLNILFGICLPALIIGLGAPSSRTFFALGWLGAMTITTTALLCWRGGLRRADGTALVALYLLFVGAIVFWPKSFAP